MTKMDQTSQNHNNIRPKWVKVKRSKIRPSWNNNFKETRWRNQVQKNHANESATKQQQSNRTRPVSNEMSWTWQKLTNVGGQRYRKTAVTLTDCECPTCPPIIKSLHAQQKMRTGGKMKMEDEKSCGAGKVRGESRITRK